MWREKGGSLNGRFPARSQPANETVTLTANGFLKALVSPVRLRSGNWRAGTYYSQRRGAWHVQGRTREDWKTNGAPHRHK